MHVLSACCDFSYVCISYLQERYVVYLRDQGKVGMRRSVIKLGLGVSLEFRHLGHAFQLEHKLREVNVRSAAAAILVIQSLDSYCKCLVVSVQVTGMFGMWYSCVNRVRGERGGRPV